MKDKRHCRGCANDFYNGKNELGVKECWSFKGAKLVKRITVGHWENPPYLNKKKITVPDCFHERGNSRTHYVDPKRISSDGFWR